MTKIVYTYNELIELIENKYDNPDIELIRQAYDMAEKAHRGVKRLTGHAYVTHPLAAAYKLADMGLHLNVVAAGLLHDVVEDTGVTIDQLEKEFGADIASLVGSVTKLKKVKYQGVERYIENLRKMFLAMASDVRVVFIKFADRLHNMQTLYAQSKEKQKRTAKEVLEIYAPIAGRLGMHEFKSEMEDLSFAYLKPKEYERMRSIMETKVKEQSGYIDKEIAEIESMLDEKTNITNYEVYGRVKKLYSLYQKLQRQDNDLSKIYDFIAIRIIVDDVEDCYAVLGLIHQKWRPLAGRIKDYIAQPKPNGYQSIHTTVFADEGEIVEVQIRTQEMHALAEYGVAAHWRYKQHGSEKTRNVKWMEELAELHKELDDKKKFLEKLEAMKIDVFKDRIFVFTPQGDVIDLPEAATPVDFAYQIHSEVGNTCSGARVNDKMSNLDTALHSGDVVEIITDNNRRGPNPDWLKFVKTRHAKKEIKEATKHSVKGWLNKVMQGRDQAKHQND